MRALTKRDLRRARVRTWSVPPRVVPIGTCVLLPAAASRDGSATAGRREAGDRRVGGDRPAPTLAGLVHGGGPRLVAGGLVGRSAGGRPLRLTVSGNPASHRRVLVVGCIHGTECAGTAIARRVLAARQAVRR